MFFYSAIVFLFILQIYFYILLCRQLFYMVYVLVQLYEVCRVVCMYIWCNCYMCDLVVVFCTLRVVVLLWYSFCVGSLFVHGCREVCVCVQVCMSSLFYYTGVRCVYRVCVGSLFVHGCREVCVCSVSVRFVCSGLGCRCVLNGGCLFWWWFLSEFSCRWFLSENIFTAKNLIRVKQYKTRNKKYILLYYNTKYIIN